MYRCDVCGGELTEVKKGEYRCNYCRAEFVLREYEPEEQISVEMLTELANDFLRLRDFDKARKYFNRALAVDPKNAEAWWGMFLADYSASDEDELLERAEIALDNVNLINARTYAVPPLKDKIREIIDIYIELGHKEKKR